MPWPGQRVRATKWGNSANTTIVVKWGPILYYVQYALKVLYIGHCLHHMLTTSHMTLRSREHSCDVPACDL